MRRPGWAAVIVATILSSLVSAAVTATLVAPEPSVRGDDTGSDDLKSRIASLERENAELRRPRRRRVAARQPVEPPVRASGGSRGVGDGQQPVNRGGESKPAAHSGSFFNAPEETVATRRENLFATSEALFEVVRDTEQTPEARARALLALAGMAAEGADTYAHELLLSGETDAGLRNAALRTIEQAVVRGAEIPSTVHALAFDPSRSSEREAAVRILVRGAPEQATSIVESMLLSGDDEEYAAGVRVAAHARDRSYLPLLTRAVNSERARAHVANLVGAIAQIKDKSWSALQLTGEPDQPLHSDLGTAWASKSPQMGRVWIELGYAHDVEPAHVRIHETFNPGAVVRVAAREPGAGWTTIWEGEAAAAEGPRWFAPSLSSAGFATREIRLELDTETVSGWNEIDAVELVGVGGTRQWVTSARASSSYSD